MNSERSIEPEGVSPVRMALMKSASVQVGKVEPAPKVKFGAGGQLEGIPGITPPDMVNP